MNDSDDDFSDDKVKDLGKKSKRSESDENEWWEGIEQKSSDHFAHDKSNQPEFEDDTEIQFSDLIKGRDVRGNFEM